MVRKVLEEIHVTQGKNTREPEDRTADAGQEGGASDQPVRNSRLGNRVRFCGKLAREAFQGEKVEN